MEVASNVSRNKCAESKGSDFVLAEKPSLRDKASQTTGTEHSSAEVKAEETTSAVSIRVTKRRGGVRLSLSNMKMVRVSDNNSYRISLVRRPYATHLTKAQFKHLIKLAPEINTTLNATEVLEQMKGKINGTQQFEPFYKDKPQGNVLSSKSPTSVPLNTKVPTTSTCAGKSDIHLHKTKIPTPSSPLPVQTKTHPQPRQSILLDQALPLKKRGRSLTSTPRRPLKRKQPPNTTKTLNPLTHQPLEKKFVIPVDK